MNCLNRAFQCSGFANCQPQEITAIKMSSPIPFRVQKLVAVTYPFTFWRSFCDIVAKFFRLFHLFYFASLIVPRVTSEGELLAYKIGLVSLRVGSIPLACFAPDTVGNGLDVGVVMPNDLIEIEVRLPRRGRVYVTLFGQMA